MFDRMMHEEGVPIEQDLLASACSTRTLRRPLMDKAFRLGARFGLPCSYPGSLPDHRYARYGSRIGEASLLVEAGCRPETPDREGRVFAHWAFDFCNLNMARWIVERDPAAWLALDSEGFFPMDLAIVEPFEAQREELAAFLAWARREMPSEARTAFGGGAWARAARLLSQGHRRGQVRSLETIFDFAPHAGSARERAEIVADLGSALSDGDLEWVAPFTRALALSEAAEIGLDAGPGNGSTKSRACSRL